MTALVCHDPLVPLLVEPAIPTGSFQAQPRLEVEGGLALRPWQPDDAAAVRTAFDCPDIQRWHIRRIDSDDEAVAWIADFAQRWSDESAASWAIVDEGDAVLGQVGLRGISLFEASADISYWVLPTARGAGVAVRALNALTDWAFDTVGMNRLMLHHSTRNLASCRVAAKASYPLEATLSQSMRHADGWHNAHLHARTAPTPAV